MKADIEQILKTIPFRVKWEDTAQPEHLDGRVLIANGLFGDVIDMQEGYVAWSPNPYTPEHAVLVWWWLVRPDLGAAIAYEAPEEVRQQIADYISEYSSESQSPVR